MLLSLYVLYTFKQWSVIEMEQFPGGVHYHRKNDEMKKIMSGASKAIIFHMR